VHRHPRLAAPRQSVSGKFAPEAADGPFARCYAVRAAEIDGMLAEGLIDRALAELFKSRAEAMCRVETQGR
jgi:hypothetical protein